MTCVLKVLISLICTAAAFGSPAARVSLVIPVESRILGGQPAVDGEVPWQVAIKTTGGSFFCAGSIISSQWMLTAGHCSDINPSNYRVHSGTLNVGGAGGTVHTITEIHTNPSFNANTFANDISVWKVSPGFAVLKSQVGAVGLPPQGTITNPDTIMTVAGWADSTALMRVDVAVVDKEECSAQYSSFGGIEADHMCAGQSAAGFCSGDSGGPLFRNRVQYGVVSWGNGCTSSTYPGVYTEVSVHRDWIRNVTGV